MSRKRKDIQAELVFLYSVSNPEYRGYVAVQHFPADPSLSLNILPNSPVLRRIARNSALAGLPPDTKVNIIQCALSLSTVGGRISSFNPEDIARAIVRSGAKRKGEWLQCGAREASETFERIRNGMAVNPTKGYAGNSAARRHPAADALDWDEAMSLIDRLCEAERYRDAMLIASGCYLGLRISDLLMLRWGDMKGSSLSVEEKKTGKTRYLRLNRNFVGIAARCRDGLCNPGDGKYILASTQSEEGRPMTRQRAAQILKDMKRDYDVRSAKVFSTHSLRKTFGRRVWMQECEKGRGDQALLLLSDVFGHSSVTITKRYLGIRREEILSVYDAL